MSKKLKVGDEVVIRAKITDIDITSDLQASVQVMIPTGYSNVHLWLDDSGVLSIQHAPEITATEYLEARREICQAHNKVHKVCTDACILTERSNNVVNTCRALERMDPDVVVTRVKDHLSRRRFLGDAPGKCTSCGKEYYPSHRTGYCPMCRPYESVPGESISGVVINK